MHDWIQLYFFFKLSPVTRRPTFFQWKVYRTCLTEMLELSEHSELNAIFQEDHLVFTLPCSPSAWLLDCFLHVLMKKGRKRKGFPDSLAGQMLSSRHTSHLNIYHSVTSSQKPLLETTLPLKDNCARIAWEGQGMARDRARSIIYQCPAVLK